MPGVEGPLAGVRVLVTRPESRAAGLIQRVREAGGEAVVFPALEIEPLAPGPGELTALAGADIVVFVSVNAVSHGRTPLGLPSGMEGKRVVAIGRATRAALEEAGCRGVIDPGEEATSEGLLASPALGNVAGRRVCIVRGRGGRELLKQELESRGADVSYLECYLRRAPEHPDTNTLLVTFAPPGPRVVTSTSTAGLSNLVRLVPPHRRNDLMSLPLVVIGVRQAEAALDAGWRGPVLEAGAGDEHIIEAIAGWLDQPR